MFVLLTSAIGIAFGALLHNTAVAIVTYFALAGAFSLLMIPALQATGNWINTGQTYGWVLDGQWAGHGAQIATSTLLWVVLPLTAGIAARCAGRCAEEQGSRYYWVSEKATQKACAVAVGGPQNTASSPSSR